MSVERRLQLIEKALCYKSISPHERELIKLNLLCMNFLKLEDEEMSQVIEPIQEGKDLLNDLDHERQVGLIVEICREIINQKNNPDLSIFWAKYSNNLPLKWKKDI